MGKCGMPWMKLNNKTTTGSKHKGNTKAVVCEGLEERWSTDEDLDRSKTKDNIYLTDITSGLDFVNLVDTTVADMSNNLRKQGKRGIREDAITSFALIVKPEEEQPIEFFETAFEVLKEKFGKDNIKAAVIHNDEGNRHMHIYGMPITEDGRLSAKDIFNLKLNTWLNEDFPRIMTEKGFKLEACRSENSYDKAYADTLTDEQLKQYKTERIEAKKANKQQHGRSSKQYKFDKELEKQQEELQQQFDEAFSDKQQEIDMDFNTIAVEKKNIRNRESQLRNKEAIFDKKVEEQVSKIKGYKKNLVDRKHQLDEREIELDTRESKISSLEAQIRLLQQQAIERLNNITKLPDDDYSRYAMGWMKNKGLTNKCLQDYYTARGLNDSFGSSGYQNEFSL